MMSLLEFNVENVLDELKIKIDMIYEIMIKNKTFTNTLLMKY